MQFNVSFKVLTKIKRLIYLNSISTKTFQTILIRLFLLHIFFEICFLLIFFPENIYFQGHEIKRLEYHSLLKICCIKFCFYPKEFLFILWYNRVNFSLNESMSTYLKSKYNHRIKRQCQNFDWINAFQWFITLMYWLSI